MKIEIVKTASKLGEIKIKNTDIIEKYPEIDEEWLIKKCGIKERYYTSKTIVELMQETIDMFEGIDIGVIVVATTSSNKLMPSLAFLAQKHLKIKDCICMDVLAGCSGYINAFDIAKKYLQDCPEKHALVIGIDKLSEYVEDKASSMMLFSDACGATVIKLNNKGTGIYTTNIVSNIDEKNILSIDVGKPMNMLGTEVYKYAITHTIENIKKLLEKAKIGIEEIAYIVPHQSNMRILETIIEKLEISREKMYLNIERVGNSFCATIPLVLDEMNKKKLINKGDKIILLGYGGGLNTGSILFEV